MPFKYVKYITRQMLKDNPNAIFVFGDNIDRIGYGGQAKEMRGEPNAFGIATKRNPFMFTWAFFDDNCEDDWKVVKNDLEALTKYIEKGYDIYVPSDGIGTGLSELPKRAPKIHQYIKDFFQNCPWE